ncbi:ABC transporter substrate-binding protein [Solidesulfovibrio sp.]|uniref:ABC transporter substrate-binding protein n=1 Tax=Solidesulfovibrio sp. TaxID=2910990 RepID=UPI00262E372E|nr:ABC transporter substrate-binding protein [Solidesulfovibrio sp.]
MTLSLRLPVRPLGRAALALAAALLFASVAAFAAGPAAPEADKPVRMASLQNDLHHLALWVALDKGFFQEEGVAVETAGMFRSGPELMTAFGAGELDAAYVGEAPATIAAVRGTAGVKVLAQANTEGSALVGSKALAAGEVSHPTLAMPGNGSVQDFLLRKALPRLGLAPEAVDVIVLSPPEMLSALQAGQIDGFIAWEPYPSRAVLQGLGQVLASSADIWTGHPCCVLAASDALVRRRPQAAQALLRAHRKATIFIHEHPDEAVAVAVRHTGMDEAVVRRALGQVTYTETPSVAGEEEYVRFLNTLGVIKVPDEAAFTREFIAGPLREAAGQ